MQNTVNEYTVMTVSQQRALGRQRVDESRDAEWQCPTCKFRIKNMQRLQNADGSECWGCRKFCDTLDASYFNGKACKCYAEGEWSGFAWP